MNKYICKYNGETFECVVVKFICRSVCIMYLYVCIIYMCVIYICISYIYIYIYNCSSTYNNPKWAIVRAYIQTVMNEKITLCEYTTQSFMFYTFVRYAFLFYLKKARAELLLNIKH